jgi:hypothetical protein
MPFVFKPSIFLVISAFLFYMELIYQYSNAPVRRLKIQQPR